MKLVRDRLFVNGRPYDEDTMKPVTQNERNTDNDETSLKSRHGSQQQQRPRSPTLVYLKAVATVQGSGYSF